MDGWLCAHNRHTIAQMAPAQSPHDPAWAESDLSADPHRSADKAERVRRMFSSIAHRYDLNNRVHSFGLDQAWRRAAVRAAQPKSTDTVLDIACGTGDLSLAFLRHGVGSVIGVDFTPAMVDIARQKSAGREHISFEVGDAQALRFADASFDVVSIAFGIRNVQDPRRAIAEFARVLRPGGRLVVLEFAEPAVPLVRALHRWYTHTLMPRTAALIAGDREGAYAYLPRSVETFLNPQELGAAIGGAGFEPVQRRLLTFGTCAITVSSRCRTMMTTA